MGVKLKASDGIDWFRPSICPLFDEGVAAVTNDAPTGCCVLLPTPLSTVKPKNWKKPLLAAAKMFITALIRFPAPRSTRPLYQRRRKPTNICGNPAERVEADLNTPSSP